MTADPIAVQRQLHAISERADELEAQVEAVARLAIDLHTLDASAVDIHQRLDQLVAHAHGGPLPKMTPGAQAIIVLDRTLRKEQDDHEGPTESEAPTTRAAEAERRPTDAHESARPDGQHAPEKAAIASDVVGGLAASGRARRRPEGRGAFNG